MHSWGCLVLAPPLPDTQPPCPAGGQQLSSLRQHSAPHVLLRSQWLWLKMNSISGRSGVWIACGSLWLWGMDRTLHFELQTICLSFFLSSLGFPGSPGFYRLLSFPLSLSSLSYVVSLCLIAVWLCMVFLLCWHPGYLKVDGF